MYDATNYCGKYSDEEIKKLQKLHEKYGNKWGVIASHMGRSAASVKDRCRLFKQSGNQGKNKETLNFFKKKLISTLYKYEPNHFSGTIFAQ